MNRLNLRVFGPLPPTLHPVHNQVGWLPRAARMSGRLGPLAFGHDAQRVQRLGQHRQQEVDPFVRAGLAHVEQLALHHLQRVGLGVDQNEQQFVIHRAQARLAASARRPLALFRFGFRPCLGVRQRLRENGQQLIEFATRQTGQGQQSLRLFLEFRVGKHMPILPYFR